MSRYNNRPEMNDFDRSVDAVIDWMRINSNWGETLVIVTADHETGYLTGPGSGQTDNGPLWNPIGNNGDSNRPGMEWHSGGHTNSLVPFFAKGRGRNNSGKPLMVKTPSGANTSITPTSPTSFSTSGLPNKAACLR